MDQINNVRKFGQCNRYGLQASLESNWNLTLFSQLLQNYTDKDVIPWLRFGWPLGRDDTLPQPGWACANHPSAVNNPSDIRKYLDKEISYGTTIGPFPTPPFDAPVGRSAMSTRRKRDSKEKRVIHDFSWPVGVSINDQIHEGFYFDEKMIYDYATVDQLAERVAQLGVTALMWKKDMKRAFKQILCCPRDVPLQGFVWENEWYFDRALIMGCRSAPYITQRCTKAIKFVHNQMGYFSIVFADDFAGAEAGHTHAWFSYIAMGNLLRDLGVQESLDKACPPGPMMVFLGTGFDAVRQVIFVIPERIYEIQMDLCKWRFKTWCTRVQLESIIGKLQFCTNCVRAGRVFINRLLNELRKMARGKWYLVNEEIRADLRWWWVFLPHLKDSYVLWPQQFLVPDEYLSCDASKKGIGAVCDKFYFHARFPEWLDAPQQNIANLEMLSLLIACKHWVHLLREKKVVIGCDNKAVVDVIGSGFARDTFLQRALRELVMLCCLHAVEIHCVHVPGERNTLPDLLSRWYHGSEFRRKFRRLTANKGYRQQPVNPQMFSIINNW